jgi:aspartyl-tRNA(Asn)/glutamyl-tRNA(Gln) amidotransferase subunit A
MTAHPCRDRLEQALARIADPKGEGARACLTVYGDTPRAAADASDARAARGRSLGPLDGVIVSIKDLFDVAGEPTRVGSKILAEEAAPAAVDAVIVKRLREAGAVIVAKTNMTEFAFSGIGANPHFGTPGNPRDRARVPGGSSAGAPVAVADGMCDIAIGTDTGGSVRIPAAYCGLVGLKPSYGRVSTRGIVPLSLRLDHVGPLARTVSDAALLLAAVAGYDAHWPYARRFPAPEPSPPASSLKGVRLGLLANLQQTTMEPSVETAWQQAIALLSAAGASLTSVTLPTYDMVRGRRAVFVRVEVEAALEHGALYRREPDRFSAAMKGYFDWGLSASAVRLAQADRTIEAAAHELSRALASLDAILTPTTPQAAFAFDAPAPDSVSDFCAPANMAGCPAISVPMGMNELGLPLGLQLIAPRGGDERLLGIALAYERAAGVGLPPPAKFAANEAPHLG